MRLDQMLMAGLLPARFLGLYVVAVAWSSISTPVLNALGSVLFPTVAKLPTREQQTVAFIQGVRFGSMCSLVIGALLALPTPWIFPLLFGSQFSAAIPCALVLVGAGFFIGLNTIIEAGLQGLGHPKAVMWSEWTGLIVTAVCLFLLLQPLEIMGAAVSSIVGYATVTVALLIAARKITGCDLTTLLIPTPNELTLAKRSLRQMFKAKIGYKPESKNIDSVI
jgi:O-antigen/teichoic acid export membrane protein